VAGGNLITDFENVPNSLINT